MMTMIWMMKRKNGRKSGNSLSSPKTEALIILQTDKT